MPLPHPANRKKNSALRTRVAAARAREIQQRAQTSHDTGDCRLPTAHDEPERQRKESGGASEQKKDLKKGACRQTRTSRAVDQSQDTNNFRKERGGMQGQGSTDKRQSKPGREEIEHMITLGRQNGQETHKEWGADPPTSQIGPEGLRELDQRSLARAVL